MFPIWVSLLDVYPIIIIKKKDYLKRAQVEKVYNLE